MSNLIKRFGGVHAVDSVSFEVRRGEMLGIIGPNGSGKTTLINLITGFYKPNTGKVVYQGKDITGLQPYKVADLGLVRSFQMVRPFYQLPAFKNLIIPLYSPRVKRFTEGRYGDRDAIALDLLGDMGFERDSSVPYKIAAALPHGYLKRMELARCLAMRPELLILDELFSGLSMAELASTLLVIEKILLEGITIIMIEHRLKELFRIANRVIVLNFGRKIAEDIPKDVMKNEEVQRAYLGTEVK